MEIKKVTDPAFRKYGRVVENIDFSGLIQALTEKTPLPADVVYEPSAEVLEAEPVFETVQKKAYGEMPVQIGYCNGHNHKLNALEYHRSSEINVAATDAILLVGHQQDITPEFTYDTVPGGSISSPEGNGSRSVCHNPALCAVQCGRAGVPGWDHTSARNQLSAGNDVHAGLGGPACLRQLTSG